MKRGQQKAYPAHTGFRHQVHLIGGLDWCDETVHALPVVSKNSDSFISFLEWLCGHIYPDDPLVIVLDNVSYHRSTSVMAALSLLEPRVQVIWLPKYSPDMNPIERYWLHLKTNVYANRLFASLADLCSRIQLWLGFQNIAHHADKLSFSNSFR